MLIDLTQEFLDVIDDADPLSAYHNYLTRHQAVLTSYWHNYVLDLDSPQSHEIIERALKATRDDLRDMLAGCDVKRLAEEAMEQACDILDLDRSVDLYLMVGVGGANAGELVVAGRPAAFVCLEHFTGKANPDTYGMGLAPALIPLWVAHELAHAVRYTASDSESELRRFVERSGGNYDIWQCGSRVPLRELLLNEGLAIHAAEAVAPGFRPAEYFGYAQRQYTRLRELEAFLRRTASPVMDQAALGLRLRYLTGGVSPASRLVGGRVIPERSGYYLGYRMSQPLVRAAGLARALRAPADAFQLAEDRERGVETA